ncbi:MAG: hypothetical protein M0Z95_21085 [Actinomycetota bacterium]|jgi:hypothetical protein|nr:hypothetical protein [Actinomycetota bacterium]
MALPPEASDVPAGGNEVDATTHEDADGVQDLGHGRADYLGNPEAGQVEEPGFADPDFDDPSLDAWVASRSRRRSGGVRVVGIVVVAALVVASIGTTIELAIGGSGTTTGTPLPTVVREIIPMGNGGSPVPGGSGSAVSVRTVQVILSVSNTSGNAVVPLCSITVRSRGRVVGMVTVHGDHAIPARTTTTGKVTVPMTEARPADTLSLGETSASCSG